MSLEITEIIEKDDICKISIVGEMDINSYLNWNWSFNRYFEKNKKRRKADFNS